MTTDPGMPTPPPPGPKPPSNPNPKPGGYRSEDPPWLVNLGRLLMLGAVLVGVPVLACLAVVALWQAMSPAT